MRACVRASKQADVPFSTDLSSSSWPNERAADLNRFRERVSGELPKPSLGIWRKVAQRAVERRDEVTVELNTRVETKKEIEEKKEGEGHNPYHGNQEADVGRIRENIWRRRPANSEE